MAKKGARILAALICKGDECGATNYITTYNKMNGDKPTLKKYCKTCREHTEHKAVTKLK